MKDIAAIKILIYIICSGMLLSTIMALISFFPKTGKETKGQGTRGDQDNLIFYMDIAKYNKEQYIKAIFKQYMKIDILESDIQKIEKDFSAEITYNANIVIRKYKWFSYAMKTDIFVLILLLIAVIMA